MKKNIVLALLLSVCVSFNLEAQRKMEYLDRGLVAVKVSGGVFLSWRMLGTEPKTIGFNVYRGTTKVNTDLITTSTNLIDANGTLTSTYTVKPVIGGVEGTADAAVSVQPNFYRSWPVTPPTVNSLPNGTTYTYNIADGSSGDLDGDGKLDLVMIWNPSNQKDNSLKGYTGDVWMDGYTLDGKRLFRIDLGKNIRSGCHYSQFVVADFDVDGKAEIMVKTAPGTKDGTGAYLSKGAAAGADNTKDYRNSSGYILSGPEWLTVFRGSDGKELATVDYNPGRGTVSSWGDSYGNRVDRFLASAAWLDGVKPSGVFQRGYYTRMAIAAWDWDGTTMKQKWYYNAATKGAEGYAMGNHNLSVGDVDGDGKDEIVQGACAIDHDGRFMYRTGLGHGDAIHLGDFDPDVDGLEVYDVHEETNAAYGYEMHSAKTGKILWGVKTGIDNGRGIAADVDLSLRGSESWNIGSYKIQDVKGKDLTYSRGMINFRCYWDADLADEALEYEKVQKLVNGKWTQILTLSDYGVHANDGNKYTPCLLADLFGDWREEIVMGATDMKSIKVFTSTELTAYKFYTLMHDPVYRCAISWQNTAYNQPPHLSYWLGAGPDKAPTPNITMVSSNFPRVGILTPASGSSFVAPATVLLTASASDVNGTITKVEFFNGTTSVGSSTASPYTVSLANLAAGSYSITAVATDNSGNKTTSSPVTVKVNVPQAAYGGTPWPIPGTIQFENYDLGGNGYAYQDNTQGNTGSAPVRTNEDVDIETCGDVGGGYNVGYATAGEWLEYTVNVAAAGTYNIDLRVACNGDNHTMSLQMGSTVVASSIVIPNTAAWQTYTTVKLTNVALTAGVQVMKVKIGATDFINLNYVTFTAVTSNKLPTVSITSPATGTSFNAPAAITLDATAADADGSVANVEFYNGLTKLGEDKTAPYSFTWNNVAAGTYTITAVATDNEGATTTSTAIKVTVVGKDCNGVMGGTAYLDNCQICVGGTTAKTACTATKAQSEDVSCDYPGIIETKNAGYEGTGYLNVDNDSNTMASFTIIMPAAATFKFGIHYANNGVGDRPCKIMVDDTVVVPSLSMPVTGAWTMYLDAETSLTLKTGLHKITLVALSINGFANLDYYYLYGDGQFGNCQIRQQSIALQKGWNLVSINLRPTDSTVARLFDGLDLVEVKNMDAFWRAGQSEILNSLKTITPGQGYLVNMNAEATLLLSGYAIEPEYKILDKTGWQLLGCPFQDANNFSLDFDGTNSNIIKDFNGFWIPDGTANSIQDCEPGHGYFLKR